MKKTIKITTIFILLALFLVTASYGFNVEDLTGSQTEVAVLKDAGNDIIKIITSIGIVISVVVLIALGIKYMMGSVEERAEYKKTLIPYLIGAALLFAASTIAQIIYEVAINL